ncbi:MAG TPA: asparagine synthase B [Candidatus Eisenbergiella merdigallinarum]|uniref:asparagine synthase (glutamine-hydrolyzing) n=1 Tax=Candidatus Eisenbergiella merdigallinarum TaxID=2838552 RepID=A0A9D2MRL4_9FIRM|nr:asparagine synthase B [Candidatus Eisenbergiella merdigallinarum]
MCSILFYAGKDMTEETLEGYLKRTQMRGPDDLRVVRTPFGLMGFARLAIMGLTPEGMQPFERDGSWAICNGELYGFRKIKKELEERGTAFLGGSDCELLLPLFEEYGLEMFSHLDAEFACVICDAKSGKTIAARDPIGIRPLFYGYSASGQIAFASEAQNLEGWVDRIRPFPPGHYYYDGDFVRYEDIGAVRGYVHGDVETIAKNIHDKLVEGVKKRLDSDAPLGFLLSGGLDSSLVCAIAAGFSEKPIRTFAIGMDTDPIDLKYAREVADFLGADHTEVIMTKEDVLGNLETVIKALGTWDITTIRASMGMYLVCRAIHEKTDLKVLLTGEISDELFGYKYTDFAPGAAAFQEEAAKRIREIFCYDVLRADRCLAANSLEARVPFGDLDFVRYVMSVDPAKKLNIWGKGKYLLRRAFEADGILPEDILWREKAAFSDAVGHSMVDDLKEYAESRYTDEEFLERSARYDYARPFTKESLLYRDIFEKYYPGQAQMIPGFWMPNREWEGCDVSDPSARVLSNYGDSGK